MTDLKPRQWGGLNWEGAENRRPAWGGGLALGLAELRSLWPGGIKVWDVCVCVWHAILTGVLKAEPEKKTYAQEIYFGYDPKVLEWGSGETEGGK